MFQKAVIRKMVKTTKDCGCILLRFLFRCLHPGSSCQGALPPTCQKAAFSFSIQSGPLYLLSELMKICAPWLLEVTLQLSILIDWGLRQRLAVYISVELVKLPCVREQMCNLLYGHQREVHCFRCALLCISLPFLLLLHPSIHFFPHFSSPP